MSLKIICLTVSSKQEILNKDFSFLFWGISLDSKENLYVAHSFNSAIYKFDPSGSLINKWGERGLLNGQFNLPYGIFVDDSDSIYVSDTYNHRIQKFSSSGEFILKWGTYGSRDGQLNGPVGITAA